MGKVRIGITSGMRGIFPVMHDGIEPIQTGETCKDVESAWREAVAWAACDEVELDAGAPDWARDLLAKLRPGIGRVC